MLVLILSRALDILFVSPGETAPFRPSSELVGQPVTSAEALIEADPALPADCQAVLDGAIIPPQHIGPDPAQGYVRSLSLRPDGQDRGDELVLTYAPGPHSAKLELAELRNHLAQAMEAQSDAVAYFDAEDRLILCNSVFANMHPGPEGPLTPGMTFEEILRRIGRHGALWGPPERQEDWIRNRLAERSKPYLTREIHQVDGRVYRLIERRILDGGRMHLLVDISELSDVRRQLAEVIAAAGFGTWSFDVDTGALTLDDRAARMIGLEGEAQLVLSQHKADEGIHPMDRPSVALAVAACLSGQTQGYVTEYRALHRAGHWVWIQSRGAVTRRHPDGRPMILSGVKLDISTQKAVESELQLRAAAITATGDGVTITDATGIIRDANPASARLFGLDGPDAMIGRPWTDFFTPETQGALRGQIATTLAQTGSWMGPALGTDAGGTTRELELSLTRMPDERIVWISRDVSARNTLARERLDLRDSVQRAQRQELVNILAAGLTHDLTNLTALISYLSDPAARRGQADGAAAMDEIHAAARQMVALLEPIRQLGRRKPMRAPTDMGAVITEAAGILQLGARSGLTVGTMLPPEPLIAELDQMQLMQVLLNLGLNARDALGDGPQRIEISLALADALPEGAQLETGVLPDAPFALITLRDTGVGIPPEMRSKIWEPFFTTKTLHGTGLGLFVVADIVRGAGGAIALTSQMGKGTSFYIAWPLSAEAAPPHGLGHHGA